MFALAPPPLIPPIMQSCCMCCMPLCMPTCVQSGCGLFSSSSRLFNSGLFSCGYRSAFGYRKQAALKNKFLI